MANSSPTPTPQRTRDRRTSNGHAPAPLRVAPVSRQRKPALIVVALLLILCSGAVAGMLFLRAGSRTAVLAVARPVPVGHIVTDRDLTVVRISVDPGLRPLAAAARPRVVGRVAAVTLVPGTLLTRAHLSTEPPISSTQAVVGVALKPGQLPGQGLQPGDLVEVERTPPPGSGQEGPARPAEGANPPAEPAPLVRQAEVRNVRTLQTSDAVVVDLVVLRTQAPDVSRAQATGQVSLVLLPGQR